MYRIYYRVYTTAASSRIDSRISDTKEDDDDAVEVFFHEVELDELLQEVGEEMENGNYHREMEAVNRFTTAITASLGPEATKRVIWDMIETRGTMLGF